MLNQLAAGSASIGPCQNAGIGSAVEDPVDGWQGVHIALEAQITMRYRHTQALQTVPVVFTARAAEIIQPMKLQGISMGMQRMSKCCPRKSTGSCNQDLHLISSHGELPQSP